MELKTLQQAIIFFSDLDNCLEYFVSRRWPDGVVCPTCGRNDVTFLAKQRKWQCKSSHKQRQFSAKVGTIFEDSPLGLDKWLMAVWMITNCKNGVSSYEIHRAIGVTQKTAWFMVHRIRVAMELGSFEKLSGTIEVDETYIGGKAKNMHKSVRKAKNITGRGMVGKTCVMGLLERKGRVKAKVIAWPDTATLNENINTVVESGSNVMTDDHGGYRNMNDAYVHEVINHAETYVNGHIHTNGIENFWSLLKRTIKGTYVSVDPQHLQKYIEEQVFRFNTRKGNDGERFLTVTSQLSGKRLTYAELTGKTVQSRLLPI